MKRLDFYRLGELGIQLHTHKQIYMENIFSTDLTLLYFILSGKIHQLLPLNHFTYNKNLKIKQTKVNKISLI